GDMPYHPNGHSNGPDEETAEIAETLAAVNRAGCVTMQSQPGCDEDGWRQRAAVELLVDDMAVRARLRALCEKAGLIYQEAQPRRWRTDYKPTVLATERISGGEWTPNTEFGAIPTRGSIRDALTVSEASVNAAETAWQVTIVDPEWGSSACLLAVLDAFSG